MKWPNRPPWYENTIFVLYGDHFPVFVHPNQYAQAKDYLNDASYRKIPIIIHIPNQNENLYNQPSEENILTLTDLFPTILHMIGAELPKGINGLHAFIPNNERSLLNVPTGGFIYQGIHYKRQINAPAIITSNAQTFSLNEPAKTL